MLAFATSALAQDITANALVGIAAGDSTEILTTEEVVRIFNDLAEGAESKPGSYLSARSNNNEISGGSGNDSNIINILVGEDSPGFGDTTVNKLTDGTGRADPGGGTIVVTQGNDMSEVAVSDSGTRMVTVQELKTATTANVISLEALPEMNLETGSVNVNTDSFQGVNTLTVTTAPTNAVINTASIIMQVTLDVQ